MFIYRRRLSRLNILIKEYDMEKQKPQKTNVLNGAQKQPLKETPEQMIRSLQGIFCKGRYRAWTFTQGKKTG